MLRDVTILIAEPQLLTTLRNEVTVTGRSLCFSASNLASALESIRALRPQIVGVESTFARSDKGRAFIDRLIVSTQAASEIQLVSHAGGRWTLTPLSVDPGTASRPQAVPAPGVPAQAGLNTRRAPRFPVFTPAEAVIDGKPTNLVDISVLGAQVVSDPVLRPKQKIKVALPDVEETILRFTAHVAWSVFEKPRPEKAPHYRAGMEFSDATALALAAYCQRHCSDSPTPIR
jgi:PilZ domain-containing protein